MTKPLFGGLREDNLMDRGEATATVAVNEGKYYQILRK
jgi:hypothetical protein